MDRFEFYDQRPRTNRRRLTPQSREFSEFYTELENYGVQRIMTRRILNNIIDYTANHESTLKGSPEQKNKLILEGLRREYPITFHILRSFRIPNQKINPLLQRIISIILGDIPPSEPGTPPALKWSNWEDLGGILTSAPAVCSWAPNRLDVFGRGQNQALWHMYWNGSRWSNWEDLGGILTSAPAAVSWGPNRIDVFGVGQNQSLWHKYWDGTSWSPWEDLGGILTSAPCVSSWQSNRLDVFGRGQDQALWHKYWDGSSWSNWESLGGILTSPPTAVSWGPNRIDVFCKGQNESIWHIYWNQSIWSSWHDLGGGTVGYGPSVTSTGRNQLNLFAGGKDNQLLYRSYHGMGFGPYTSLGGSITSEPAAVSWGNNRLDAFARGQNRSLWHIYRP